MIERHLTRLRARHVVSEAEEQAIRDLLEDTRTIAPRTTFIREGQRLERSTLLLDGLMCRYKDLSSGARQVTAIHVPGDFVDLHGFTLKSLDHDLQALTSCTIALAPHDRLRALTETHPRLMRLYWFSTNLDAAIHREWVVSLGRRSAAERVAALFCELRVRLGIVGLADATGFALPITQIDLAESLGLTSVHVNRVLRQLRENRLATFQGGRVTLLDEPGLRRLADFDDSYLYLHPAEL